MEGLIFGGAYIRRGLSTERNLRFKIDWVSLIVGRKFTVFALYLRAISKYKPPVGAYIRRGDLTESFCVTSFGGLYSVEGLVHGGAYFRNFTVFLSVTIK